MSGDANRQALCQNIFPDHSTGAKYGLVTYGHSREYCANGFSSDSLADFDGGVVSL